MRVLCCRACSSSRTCCSSDAGPAGGSPSRATPSRQPGMDEVLRNLPVRVAPGRRAATPGRSASACGDSLGDACGEGGWHRDLPPSSTCPQLGTLGCSQFSPRVPQLLSCGETEARTQPWGNTGTLDTAVAAENPPVPTQQSPHGAPGPQATPMGHQVPVPPPRRSPHCACGSQVPVPPP